MATPPDLNSTSYATLKGSHFKRACFDPFMVGLILTLLPWALPTAIQFNRFAVTGLLGKANKMGLVNYFTRLFRRRRKSIRTNCERFDGLAK